MELASTKAASDASRSKRASKYMKHMMSRNVGDCGENKECVVEMRRWNEAKKNRMI